MLSATGLRNPRKYRYLTHQIRNSKVIKTLDFHVFSFICARNVTHVSYDGRFPKQVTNDRIEIPDHELTKEDVLIDSLQGKLVYSSVLTKRNEYYRWKLWKKSVKRHVVEGKIPDTESSIPISLRYIYDDSETKDGKLPSKEIDSEESNQVINMPYSKTSDYTRTENYEDEMNEDDDADYDKFPETMIDDRIASRPAGKKWMSDYECYDETVETDEIETWQATYGTADSSVPISKVPCGGCGALLHCQDTSIPGYLPKELFVPCSEEDLKTVICQRCTFLKKYNIALDVTVSPQDYPTFMFSLRKKRALFILMIDMMDYPCSIWPDLIELIGESKPIIIVGNKIDLVPGDSNQWLLNAKASLKAELPKNANIKYVSLISAKTGYGVEELITKLQQIWDVRGDVYLVGCTNVGKSTLFNALLQSDYCDVKAVDLVLRATTSPWPGTTLNLLKFPIMKPEGWRLYQRSMRLRHLKITKQKEKELEEYKAQYYNTKINKLPDMIGHIGMTFDIERKEGRQDPFDLSKTKLDSEFTSKKSIDENSKDYKYSKWFYDTPGVVHPDQINALLTTEELVKTNPRETINPRMYSLRPNQTVFIAGLGRVDLSSLENFARIIIYASQELPITMCETCYADEVYEKLLGTSILAVPIGNEARLSKWPGLAPAPEFTLTGRTMVIAAGEIVISNIGWFTVYATSDIEFKLKVWSPGGKGIHLRKEPLLVRAPRFRKRRILNTPGYYMAKP